MTIVFAIVNIVRGGSTTLGIRWTTIVIASIAAAGLFVHREDLLRLLRRSRAAEDRNPVTGAKRVQGHPSRLVRG